MLGLGVAMTFASCANEEAVNPTKTTDITVTVKTEGLVHSRAIETVEGYELKCVMQLLKEEDNTTVGTQDIQSAVGGTASFTIKAEDIDAGAGKALFWAEYVPTSGGTKVYNSEDLLNVKYNVQAIDFSNPALAAAADAYAGKLTTFENGASVTLTRPLIRLNLKATNPEVAEAAKKLTVTYDAPSGYNVLTNNCNTDAYEALTYTNASFDYSAEDWFVSYIFAPANLSKLDKEITLTLADGVDWTGVIEADKFPLDANYLVEGTFEVDLSQSTQPVDVTVSLDGHYANEPKPAEFEVGAYLTAAGVPTDKVDDAVAVVFYVGEMTTAYGTDNISGYNEKYSGKTIKGYAVALNQAGTIASVDFGVYGETSSDNANMKKLNPEANTNSLLANEAFKQTEMYTLFNNFKAQKALTATETTTTDWYLPSVHQLQWWTSAIATTEGINGALGEAGTTYNSERIESLTKIFDKDNIYYDSSYPVTRFISSSLNDNANIAGIELGKLSTQVIRIKGFSGTMTNAAIRPMFTIFE